jgi:glucose-6-phosphate isomerase
VTAASGRSILSLGSHQGAVDQAVSRATSERMSSRIWSKDAALWKSDEASQENIASALGWLDIVGAMREKTGDLRIIAEDIRANFDDVVVLGMGGSSLCPEVLRRSFGSAKGFPRLRVLDSTVPDAVRSLTAQLRLDRALFIVASKSGTTTEPRMFYRYFRGLIDDGSHFLAITDPHTALAEEATRDRFRHVVLNPADIGGRYSALSNFGMLPAALAGIDVEGMLARAGEAACNCASEQDDNWGVRLGAALGTLAKEGRDKLTLVTGSPVDSVGLWIEQLIAESTGKEGKGIIPVAGEVLGEPAAYGDDRVFVWIHIADDTGVRAKLDALAAAGHPVIEHRLRDALDLGAEFFFWEFATAVAGAIMEINPFDQPNVQESKDNTKRLLDEYLMEGRLPEVAASGVEAVMEHLRKVRPDDYVAITQYIEETEANDALLAEIQSLVSHRLRVATTTGYGPRFLHSTGQLHKGGPDSGVFIQINESEQEDVPITGERFGFRVLAEAQALGDYQSLASRDRRAIRLRVPQATAGLQQLRDLLRELEGEHR